jgi:hypothetical protein
MVFENRVLRWVLRPKRDEVTGEWSQLHSDLYCSHNIVRVIKSRRMRWAGHIARRRKVCIGVWLENLREGDHWGDPGVDGRIIL